MTSVDLTGRLFVRGNLLPQQCCAVASSVCYVLSAAARLLAPTSQTFTDKDTYAADCTCRSGNAGHSGAFGLLLVTPICMLAMVSCKQYVLWVLLPAR